MGSVNYTGMGWIVFNDMWRKDRVFVAIVGVSGLLTRAEADSVAFVFAAFGIWRLPDKWMQLPPATGDTGVEFSVSSLVTVSQLRCY